MRTDKKNHTPEISVIINCLDGERYLPAALDSLKGQTFQNFEVIFWDNNSTDGSAEIAHGFGPKLRYFKSQETVPLGEARNLAIKEARGKLIAFLDCDDLWRPTKLEKQAQLFAVNDNLGLVCTDTEIFRDKTLINRLFFQTAPQRGRVFEQLMKNQWISMSSAMASKKALDDVADKMAAHFPGQKEYWFDESLNVCEEADLFYRIAYDWEIDFVDEPLTVWRIHNSNTTFEKFGQFGEETGRILEKHKRLYSEYEKNYPELVDMLKTRSAFQKAIALWRIGQNSGARKLIAPHKEKAIKYKLFWLATFLPGSAFDVISRIYFRLPAWIKKARES